MAKRSKRSAAARRRHDVVRASAPAHKAQEPKVEAVDFQVEYRYVLADLKRFSILAVAMIALLVVLALVL